MLSLNMNYSHPWLLLLIIPAVLFTLVPYFRSSKKYRRTRNRIISMTLHIIAMVLAINLLAGLIFSYEIPNEDNEVILLVDVSESNAESQAKKDEFIQSVLNVCEDEFKVGIVKFGFDQIYAAELSVDTQAVYEQYLTSADPDTSATDLASALKYASGLFKKPESAKIVVISDGVETDRAAVSVIKAIAADGIKVDTVYYPNEVHDEIQILSVVTPDQHIVPGEPFTTELTLRHNLGKADQELKLHLYDNDVLLGSVDVVVNKEEQTFPVSVALQERGLHDLRFVIEHGNDKLVQNNAYHTYVNMQTFENVLLIERNENESEKLQELLNENYKVTALSIEEDVAQIPQNIHEMAKFEQVILVNIAYSDMPPGFEALLNEYVYNLGGGLFTVGGENDMINGKIVPHAYNRADIENSTYYKQMLPVNVVDYTPPIAVMIVVDTSASMSMGKLEAAVEGAEACLDALNDRDYCGVMSFETRASEELEVLPVSHREEILEAIRKIGHDQSATGGTIFSDAIMKAGRALSVIENVERRHIIMVTDGNPGDAYEVYAPYIQQNVADGITMSIVTVDIATDLKEGMEKTAAEGGGKFYNVAQSELHTIPEVMQRDLALEAIAEIQYGEEFIPKIRDITSVVANIRQEDMAPLTGYYGTVKKEDAVVPLMGDYVPIYAQWKYGEGNVGSFMCDLNGEWSQSFITADSGKTIIRNIVDNLFPMNDVVADEIDYVIKTDNYTSQINVHSVGEGNRVQVLVKALTGALKDTPAGNISVTAAEDSRRFTYEIKDSGLYEVRIQILDEAGVMVSETVTYQTFSYSQEYNAFITKQPIGEELMTLLATDGNGVVVEDPVEVFQSFEKTLHREFDPRWVFLILVIVLVLLDIAVRKFKFKWPHELIREHKQKKASGHES